MTSKFFPRKICKVVHLQPQQIVETVIENQEEVKKEEITKPPHEISAHIYNFEDPKDRSAYKAKGVDKRVSLGTEVLREIIS